MKNKVLLVGGTGYLGSHLNDQLKDDFDIYLTGSSIRNEKRYFQIDYRSPETFHNIQNERFAIVIFLAASITGIGKTDVNHLDVRVNGFGFADFLQYVIDHEIAERFIYISSMTVYSPDNILPVTEAGSIQPLNSYGLSKVIAEETIRFAAIRNSIPLVIVRLPGLFGGTRRSGYVYNTIRACLANRQIDIKTEGLGYWETIEVDDACLVISLLLKSYDWKVPVECFNIGYGKEIDFVDVAYLIKNLTLSKSEINVLGEKGYRPMYLSTSKVRSVVSFDLSMEEGLGKFIEKIRKEV